MDSMSSVSPSIVLPLRRHHHHHYHHHRRRHPSVPLTCDRSLLLVRTTKQKGYSNMRKVWCSSSKVSVQGEDDDDGDDGDDGDDDKKSEPELERALRMDGAIPGTSDEFVKQVSSRAYDMRRNLHHTFDTSSYDVLEKNPWREAAKSVYVLTHQENQLCTMKTRRNRSEVERKFGLLFSKRRNGRNQSKQSGTSTKFQMVVEDVQEGVLVFEDQNEAARYCDLLQGGGQNCEGVTEIEASSVFDLCQKNRALAVLFRWGRTPPLPENLKLNLKARKRSLED